MTIDIATLRGLLAKATPLPWKQDDGNIFSAPLSQLRHDNVMARFRGEDVPRLDDEDATHPMDFVASTDQFQESFDEDADLICAAVNALPALLDRMERLERIKAAAIEVCRCAPLAGHVDGPRRIEALRDAIGFPRWMGGDALAKDGV